MDMEIPSHLSEHWEISTRGDIPGTFADGIPLAGSSRAPRLHWQTLGVRPSKDHYRDVVLFTAGGTTMASTTFA